MSLSSLVDVQFDIQSDQEMTVLKHSFPKKLKVLEADQDVQGII
jgi:hypothetical protein